MAAESHGAEEAEDGELASLESCVSTIDVIPDSIISLILSKLVEARWIAQAATVCRRWRYCSSGVHVMRLMFHVSGSRHSISSGTESMTSSSSSSSASSSRSTLNHRHPRSNAEMLQIFARMLKGCCGLRELLIDSMRCTSQTFADMLCGWVQDLSQSLEVFEYQGKLDVDDKLLHALSCCPKLRSMQLVDEMICGCMYSKFLIRGDNPLFISLRKCVLVNLELDDSKLELLLKLCPLLEVFELSFTQGLETPSITANNLLHLKVIGQADKEYRFYEDDYSAATIKCLTINAPKLTTLVIDGVKEARLDGSALSELRARSYFKPVFKKTPRLQVLEIAHKGWTVPSIYQFLDMAKSAREISIHVKISRTQPMSFHEIFEDFTELKTLNIGLHMFEALQAGKCSKTEMQAPPPLREVSVVAHSGTKNTIGLLSSLLECRTLSCLRLSLLERPSGTFCTSLLKLQAQHHQVSILVEAQDTDDDEDDESEYEDDLSFSDALNEDDDDDDDDDDDEDEDDDGDDEEDEDEDFETDYEDFN